MSDDMVLIADDAAFMRRMLRMALTNVGVTEFLEASNGKEAVDLYREHHPVLVFMDVTMPEMNGLDALKEIMAMDPEAKVIMCSAIGQDVTIMDAIRSGATEFIVKPFKPEEIVDLVSNILG